VMTPVPVTNPLPAKPVESQNNDVPNEQISIELTGVWQSTQDTRFVREFRSDGTVTDRYEGMDDATSTGSWNFVEDPSKEQDELPAVHNAKILKIQFPEEVLYFALINLTDTGLTLSYLGRGNTLEFTRVN